MRTVYLALYFRHMMKTTNAKTVPAYIKAFPPKIATRLRAVRAILKKEAPEAVEKISYHMAGYTLNGHLHFFSATEKHVAFYILPKGIGKEVDPYRSRSSTNTLHFPHTKPLPLPLIRKVVKLRVKEALKRKKTSR